MTKHEELFLAAVNAAADHANRPGGPGADYVGICNKLAPAYRLTPSRACEIVVENVIENLRA